MTLRRRAFDRVVAGALVAPAAALAVAAFSGGCAQIAGLSDHQLYPVVQIAAGLTHACALMRNGEVWCWGANDTGQLGHRSGDGGDCTSACAAAPVEGVSGATRISAGAGFTCAVGSDGHVQCWGRDDSGQLGRGTGGTACAGVTCDPVPAPVTGISGAVQVSAGGGYACARTAGGGVLCWGDNTYGQLGTGNFKASPTATLTVLGKAVDVSAALVGANTCAALADGSVSCWGLNVSGGAGHPPGMAGDVPAMKDNRLSNPGPTPVVTIQGAVTVRTANNAGCAGLGISGFSCWGYDGLDCLGTPTTGAMNINLPPQKVAVVPGLAMLDLGTTTACGVDAAGEAWCWGESGMGALGPETGTPETCDLSQHCQRQAQNVGLGSVIQIAAGGSLAVALLADGTVWAWGANDEGQLGHPPGSHKDTNCPASTGDLCNATPNRVLELPP